MKLNKRRIIVLLFLLSSYAINASEVSFISNGYLWIINDDNTGLTQLTDVPREYLYIQKWSPDGKKLAFISNLGLEMIDIDLGTIKFLGNYYQSHHFDWSPDSKNIIIATGNTSQNNALELINVEDVSLVYQLVAPMYCQYPFWSNDGSKIAFSSRSTQDTTNNGVYIINSNGQNLRKLNNGWRCWGWSFDDTNLFISNKFPSNIFTDLLAYNLATSTTIPISDSVRHSLNVSISPLENKVAFNVEHIYSVYGDTYGATEAMICEIGGTPTGYGWTPMYGPYETSTNKPQWSNAGDQIAFKEITPYARSIYVDDLAGSITKLADVDGGILWSHDDKTILSGSNFVDLATGAINAIQASGSIRLATWRPPVITSLIVKDAQDNKLSNTDVYLIRVNNDSPNYTEDTLGVVKTDGSGLIELKPR